MRRLLPLVLLLSAPAVAGTLTVEKKGIQPAHVFVDGAPQGKLKKKEPLTVELEPGVHEVAASFDENGTLLRCIGTVTIAGGATTALIRDAGCEGLGQGAAPGGTIARGGFVAVKGDAAGGKWLTIDGGEQVVVPHGGAGITLNLTAGRHVLVLTEDVHGAQVACQGQVAVSAGATSPLVVTTSGCVGFVDVVQLQIQ